MLSLVGFVSSAAPVTSRVLKGADEADKTRTESKIKKNKVAQGQKSATTQTAAKVKKSGAKQYPIEHGKEASATSTKTDTWVKGQKQKANANAAAQEANKKANQSQEK
ncbi:MAG TPA: hypothetical protein VKW06_10260 [Candidatus Angelobacter sp.]|nr:hypothetical protein [Candidatus Angelobacter sp.]